MDIAQTGRSASAHELFLRTRTFSALNGVRCLCCLSVIVRHVEWTPPGPRLLDHGNLGVDLFFVISGFLIVTLLIRERERRGDISLKKFYTRRSLRIFPIYYLTIFIVFLFYLAVSPWAPNGLNYYRYAFLVLLIYAQDVIWISYGNFFHCWSLAMEEQFYLFWPSIEKYAKRSLRWVVIGLLLAINQMVSFGFLDGAITRLYGDPGALRLQLYIITFTPILLGVVLAYLLNERGSFNVLFQLIGWRLSPFLFLGLLFAICEYVPDLVPGWGRLATHVTLMLLLGSLVAREDHYARPFLTLRPIARIGVISYGVYLYHVWVIQGVIAAQNRFDFKVLEKPQGFVLVTAGTIVVAELSYRLIEAPLLRYKERFHS